MGVELNFIFIILKSEKPVSKNSVFKKGCSKVRARRKLFIIDATHVS